MAVLAQWSGKTILQQPCPWVWSDWPLATEEKITQRVGIARTEAGRLGATQVPSLATGWPHGWLLHRDDLYGQLRGNVILQMNNFYSQMIPHTGLRSCPDLLRSKSLITQPHPPSSSDPTPGSSATSLPASWVSPFPK